MQVPPPHPPNKEGPFLPCLERQGLPGPISVIYSVYNNWADLIWPEAK